MIDINNGNFIINKLQITSNTKYNQFIEILSLNSIVFTIREINNECKIVKCANINFELQFISISCSFYRDIIKHISFIIDKKKGIDSWKNWSEENELKKYQKLEAWLTKEIGIERKFNWGEIWCSFDQKGGCASIGLRYKESV